MDQHVSQQWEKKVLIENPCDCNLTVSHFCEFPYSLTHGPVSRSGNACPFRVPFNWLARPSNFCEHWVLGYTLQAQGRYNGQEVHFCSIGLHPMADWYGSQYFSTLLQVELSKAAGGCRLKALFTWAVSLSSSISPLLLLSHFLRMPLHKSVWVRSSQFCS